MNLSLPRAERSTRVRYPILSGFFSLFSYILCTASNSSQLPTLTYLRVEQEGGKLISISSPSGCERVYCSQNVLIPSHVLFLFDLFFFIAPSLSLYLVLFHSFLIPQQYCQGLLPACGHFPPPHLPVLCSITVPGSLRQALRDYFSFGRFYQPFITAYYVKNIFSTIFFLFLRFSRFSG